MTVSTFGFSCDKDKEVLSKTNYEINKLMKKDNTLIRLILFFCQAKMKG